MVGSGANYSFQLTVPGGVAPAAGVTAIAVLPSHRRRGILTSMMGRLFADAAARSEPLAVLFASEAGIYSRFGFGLGSMELHLTVRRGEGRLAPGVLRGRPARRRGAAAGRRAGRPRGPIWPGSSTPNWPAGRALLARDERWWTYLLTDLPAMRPARTSPVRCLLAEDDDGPRGYALYRTSSNWSDHLAEGVVEVHELYAADPAATAALWSDLLSRDLVGETRIRRRPVDEPLLAMLADPRRGPGHARRRAVGARARPAGRAGPAPVRGRRRPRARGHRPADRRQRRPLAAARWRSVRRQPPAATGPATPPTSGSPFRRSAPPTSAAVSSASSPPPATRPS